MMEGFTVLYWHWLVFGMVLMIMELAVPSFTIFWFGLGGLVVGTLLLVFSGLTVPWQIFLWVVASSGFAVFWFKVMKPRMTDRTKAGISREAVLGETAMVVRAAQNDQRGQLRFSVPILGSDTWSFICSTPVQVGERVMVRELSGNTMIVEPANMASSAPSNEGE
jgi:inner membrane protein